MTRRVMALIAETNTPPYAVGERVYLPDHPDSGSMTVADCKYHGEAGWRVTAAGPGVAGLAPWSITADAGDFARVPKGWTEPPILPPNTECPAVNLLATELFREAEQAWRAHFAELVARDSDNG